MGKPQTPNQKKANNALNARLSKYMARVQGIYDELCRQTANIVEATAYDGASAFHFEDYPDVAQMVEDLKSDFFGKMRGVIYSGTSEEWKQSNMIQDVLAKKVLKYYDAQLSGQQERVYFQSNSDALRAFQNRTEHGMNLSAKIWNQSDNYVQEMEYAISSAIEKGMSAVTLSKRLSQYLNDFESLKADYEEKYAHAVECADCEYRSIRLARSEINMAYRNAEQARWQQFDFILGYEIKMSGSHPKPDICDVLTGRYPKDFHFTGWHPNCMCYCVPIVMAEDDYWNMREGKPVETEPVSDVPESMKKWMADNQQKVEAAESRDTLPYWLRDNNYKTYSTDFAKNAYEVADTILPINAISRLVEANAEITTEEVFSREGVYRSDRAALHRNIVKDYIQGSHAESDFVYMLGGAPANGKSTLVESGLLPHPKEALVIDPDKLKAKIPEYKAMVESGRKGLIAKAANFVHEESSILGKSIQTEAYRNDICVVLDGVNGGSIEKVEKKIQGIRAASGKKVRADYVALDTDLSLKLAQARAKKTGRVVPESFIQSSNRNIAELIPQIIKKNLFDELYLWDTNVNGTPRLILKMIGGKLEVIEPELYKNFLNKAK
jgi:predicted ABC-type ATPase